MLKIIDVRYWVLEVGGFDEAVLSSNPSYLTSNLKKRLPPSKHTQNERKG
ncbi:hypothetical protein [Riemerella anatipestifer]|nr:hypothetical protein [Riemerella anatipestifer]MCU7542257.1 hypothetical protein [Riemerella anatipestifer]MCW0513150.1 hypothetical protein [Riemerella anatipestifer]MDY3434162.1 hypothetical protein [Riemerella anatipestifer]